MGWECHNGHRYYYRSVRTGKRVRSFYMGTGPVAELAAAEDQRRRAERHALAQARRAEQARLRAADAPLLDFINLTELAARSALVGANYHQHDRGEWRKRRQ